ncbi:MAG TPA: hypothetical protein VH280_20535 [Verrucomicrobiae bacterium]|nr:hypothetical protein [Verrucomicrobiae bacterium]
MTNEDYHKQLEQVAEALTSAGCSVSIRGDGVARFIFAEQHGRAVEIYGGEPEIYVECFSSGEEYASTETQESSYEATTRRALDWLSQA